MLGHLHSVGGGDVIALLPTSWLRCSVVANGVINGLESGIGCGCRVRIHRLDGFVSPRKKQDRDREKPSERLNGSPDKIKQKVTVRAGV